MSYDIKLSDPNRLIIRRYPGCLAKGFVTFMGLSIFGFTGLLAWLALELMDHSVLSCQHQSGQVNCRLTRITPIRQSSQSIGDLRQATSLSDQSGNGLQLQASSGWLRVDYFLASTEEDVDAINQFVANSAVSQSLTITTPQRPMGVIWSVSIFAVLLSSPFLAGWIKLLHSFGPSTYTFDRLLDHITIQRSHWLKLPPQIISLDEIEGAEIQVLKSRRRRTGSNSTPIIQMRLLTRTARPIFLTDAADPQVVEAINGFLEKNRSEPGKTQICPAISNRLVP
ncbi:MAG: FkbM family methyltransferase [Synechococcaceae cyanobacterium SM2_3_1]|nr:FkbM family methyltransferase [Synechococcaceae cyanobacterium SM2_3_1]